MYNYIKFNNAKFFWKTSLVGFRNNSFLLANEHNYIVNRHLFLLYIIYLELNDIVLV